ncbi:glucose-methanol-choline (GMC) oxidoreductase family protein [Wolffia australiana]
MAVGRLARFLSIFLLFLVNVSSEQEPSYARFSFDASMFPTEAEYDYIVVGGGTAGCPLAATLSHAYRVLLLERGGVPHEFPNLATQEGFLAALSETDSQDSPAQAFVSEEGVPNARGRVLGGGSAINAGFYSRAEPDFFEQSAIRWNMAMVNDSYEWVERTVTFQPLLGTWQSAVRDSLLEANVTPYNDFTVLHVRGTKIGASTFDSAGRRHTAADLLASADPANIQVAVRATVEKILIQPSVLGKTKKPTAVGVAYRDQFGARHVAKTRDGGEVILSAGALGSPQLLLLSGVGPRGHLQSMGVSVLRHHPHVGKFVYDNPRNGISIAPPAPLEHSLIQVVGITDSGAFLEAASTVVAFSSPGRAALLHRAAPPLFLTVATLMEKVGSPLSHGWLRLASTDPRDNPRVRFNYFAHRADLARCVDGLRTVGAVLEAQSMDKFKVGLFGLGRAFRFVGPALPANRSRAAMEEFCRQTLTTIWHYHGGCVAGKVVNGDLKLAGVDSLRVVDGSVLSTSPGTNPQATIMMLGRYTAQKLLLERKKKRKPADAHSS